MRTHYELHSNVFMIPFNQTQARAERLMPYVSAPPIDHHQIIIMNALFIPVLVITSWVPNVNQKDIYIIPDKYLIRK